MTRPLGPLTAMIEGCISMMMYHTPCARSFLGWGWLTRLAGGFIVW